MFLSWQDCAAFERGVQNLIQFADASARSAALLSCVPD
jgi:hypothetical protein